MTTHTLDRRDRSAQIIPIGTFAAGVALAAVVAVAAFGGGGGGRGSNSGGPGVPPASERPSAPADPTAVPTPDVTPLPTPVVTPKPPVETPAPPSRTPVPDETDGGPDAMPIKVDLENVSGADVYVDIVDETGLIVRAESGKPAEGQSVDQNTLEVENLDASTLKLTWVDYPIDNALGLHVFEHEGRLRLLLVQPAPTGPTDTVALDRELILSFSEPISANDVDALLREGLDTPG